MRNNFTSRQCCRPEKSFRRREFRLEVRLGRSFENHRHIDYRLKPSSLYTPEKERIFTYTDKKAVFPPMDSYLSNIINEIEKGNLFSGI